MFLAIEIGGTKLQLGVGAGAGQPLQALERRTVDPAGRSAGILQQILEEAPDLILQHGVRAIGIGFGGPIDRSRGAVIKSHQIEGWENFSITAWSRQTLQRPTCLGNDSDLAGLAEARFGAGKGHRVVFYSNVGSGIGGALVIDGELYLGGKSGASEIGHLRPHWEQPGANHTVESLASGWGMTAAARAGLLDGEGRDDPSVRELLALCADDVSRLDGKFLATALIRGNAFAADIFRQGIRAYGWGLAQVITLLGPDVVVVGGGIPLTGEEHYLAPLRSCVEECVFSPRRGTYQLKPAELGEEMVLHGALALAATTV